MKHLFSAFLLLFSLALSAQELHLNKEGYFEMPGLNVMVFSDIYPDGHQTGVTIIQHGVRTAANGDLRLEPSPGQWSPMPKGGKLTVDSVHEVLTQRLWYPDSSKNRKGFNPIFYPDLAFFYNVSVTPLRGNSFKVTVSLDKPLPSGWIGKVGFNLELFPGTLFGKSYLMDEQSGIFPRQPEGPVNNYNGEFLSAPLAKGRKLVVAPEEDKQRLTIQTLTSDLELWDGRSNHNNGWYIVRSVVPANASAKAVEWVITPNVVSGWTYEPVLQVSQVGYHSDQPKRVIIEQDKRDSIADEVTLYQLVENGRQKVQSGKATAYGRFLRYNYFTYDFSNVKNPGMYEVSYRGKVSHPFRIADDVYDRHAWQPTMDYFLPVQMCHMRVNEKYRVWHGLCHMDDALMAPADTNHFDGYLQGPSTLTKYKPLEPVPGLNSGGWHDAGDYDLRVESQIGTTWLLAMMIEEFGFHYDATTIDEVNHIVEIHQPDGKDDALQQIEHGLSTVLGGYRSLGRLYRGMICNNLKQYVLLGDGSTMTDGLVYDASLAKNETRDNRSGRLDDRLVFTEENLGRELYVAAGLAAASRVLKASNPALSKECIETALALYHGAADKARYPAVKIIPLAELILTTDDPAFKKEFVSMKDDIIKSIDHTGWEVGHVIGRIDDKKFSRDIAAAVATYQEKLRVDSKSSPFGVPYRPNIWGAGWSIQSFGVDQYFFHKAWPALAGDDFYVNALNFVLGVHPGSNTASFASGVGSESATVAYGANRADWSYIPGGVISGTNLVRPDFPELKVWPFFWQQTEYVMGGGATNYMFLVLAVDKLYAGKK